MMRLHIKIYKAICLIILLNLCFYSCMSDNLDDRGLNPNKKGAQLQIEINKTNAQNLLDYKSQIENVRLLMFDSKTEQCVVNQKLEIAGNSDLKAFKNKLQLQFDQIKLHPGIYDVVLLANENSSISDLTAYRAALDLVKFKIDLYRTDLMKIPYGYNSDRTYSSPKGPLLMSAYLKNVKIDRGSTEDPYKLKAPLTAAMSLIEVVFKNEKENGELFFTDKRVSKIVLKNMLNYYSNPAIIDAEIDRNSFINLSSEISIAPANYQEEEIGSFRFYVPEVIQEEVDTALETPVTIELSGSSFDPKEIQLRSNTRLFLEDLQSQQRLYSDKLTGLEFNNENTNNFLRNYISRVTVVLARATHEIRASVEVLPWDTQESNRDYIEAEVSSDFDKFLTDSATHTITVGGQSFLTFSVNIKGPEGAPWRLSLTNGLDFGIQPHTSSNQTGEIGATQGIVNGNTTYKFDIVPLKPFTGLPRYTEVFLVVDGKEEQLIPRLKKENVASGPHNRYKIKQVE